MKEVTVQVRNSRGQRKLNASFSGTGHWHSDYSKTLSPQPENAARDDKIANKCIDDFGSKVLVVMGNDIVHDVIVPSPRILDQEILDQ